MIPTEVNLPESLVRRLHIALDRYPTLTLDTFCSEALGCYLSLLDLAETPWEGC